MQGGSHFECPPYALRARGDSGDDAREVRSGSPSPLHIRQFRGVLSLNSPPCALGYPPTRLGLRTMVVLLLLVATVSSAQPRPVDLVVRHGTVVAVDPAHRVIADGAVAIEGGRIVAVGPATDVEAAFRGRETL